MKKSIIILLTILCLFILASCDSCGLYDEDYVYDGNSLIGKWVDEKLDEYAYDVYEFIDNNKVNLTTNCRGISLKTIEGTYTVEDNNKIVISSVFGKEYIRFSITDSGKLVLLTLTDLNTPVEDERVMVKYNLEYNEGENKLIGTWKSKDNPDEKFVFNEDFTGKSIGLSSKGEETSYKIYYSYKGNELNIIIEYMINLEEMVRTTEFKIENNILTMSGSDKDGKEINIIFEREE